MSGGAHGFAVLLSTRARQLLQRSEKPSGVDSFSSTAVASGTICSAVIDALHRGETHYTDRPGVLELRMAIAEKLTGRFAIAVDAGADVVITCGVTEARFVAAQQLLAPGTILAAPLVGERMEGAAMLRRAQLVTAIGTNADAVYLTSSMPGSECRAAIELAPANANILYEIDEHTSSFHPGQLKDCVERTTTIGNLGDDGWRIGYLVSPRPASPGMRDFKQALTICSTNLSQWALLAALEAGEVTL